MGTSPLQSLQESTPKPYMIWYHSNLQTQLKIQLKFRGMSAKITLHAYRKRLKGLNHYHHATPWEKLPKIHIWHGHFEFEQNFDKTRKWKGLICKIAPLRFLEGTN